MGKDKEKDQDQEKEHKPKKGWLVTELYHGRDFVAERVPFIPRATTGKKECDKIEIPQSKGQPFMFRTSGINGQVFQDAAQPKSS